MKKQMSMWALFLMMGLMVGMGYSQATGYSIDRFTSGAWDDMWGWSPAEVPTMTNIATISRGLAVELTDVPNDTTGAAGIWLGNENNTSGTFTMNAGIPTNQWFWVLRDVDGPYTGGLLIGNKPGARGILNQYGGKLYSVLTVLGQSGGSALCTMTVDGPDVISGHGDFSMGNAGAGAVLNIKGVQATGRVITDNFEYADQAAFNAAWPKDYPPNGCILSDTTPLGTGKGLLTDAAHAAAGNQRDYGDPEPGIASIQIYDAGGGDAAEFFVISNGGTYQFAELAIDPKNSSNYRIRTYNFTGYGNGFRETAVARSTGAHTFKIEWPATGTVLFYIDDALVSTAYNGNTVGFDAIDLGHGLPSGTAPLNAHAYDNLNIYPNPVGQGSTFDSSTFTMSVHDNTVSTVNMTGGTMNVGGYAWIGYAANQIAVFNLNLGANGEPNNGTLVNRAGGQAHKLAIGGGAINARDVFQGNGVVALSGVLELDGGRVIADGGAGTTTDKTLDMSTFAQILKDLPNPTDNGTSGFYARNRGKLVLPPVAVASGSNPYTWGEDPEDYDIDLTNSVLMSFSNVTAGDNITVSLLAPNRFDVGNTDAFNFIGIWNFSPGPLFNFGGSGSVNLTFRYDDLQAADLGINQADLKVWHKVGGTWVDVTSGVDTANKRISANGINSLSLFAVGAVVTQVATPNFNPSNPLVYNTLNPIVITCATPSATIRYTTNGVDPTEDNGTVIASGGSVNVTDGTTLKARAWKTGLTPSAVQSVTYTAPPLNGPQTIPQMSGVTVDGNLADWAGAEWIPLNEIYNGSPSDIADALFALKWDPATPSKVYFAVKVRDTAHFFTDTYTAWNARDAVELYLHTTGVSDDQSFTYSEAAQQLTIGISNTARDVVWSSLGDNMSIPASGYEFQAAGHEDGEWLYYEAAMTSYNYMGGFTSLPSVLAPLIPGQIIGVDVVVAGRNGTAYTGMKSENAKTGKSTNYNQFGLHRLVAGSPFVATPADLAAVLAAMDSTATSGNWNVAADFDSDGEVTSSDLAFVLANLP